MRVPQKVGIAGAVIATIGIIFGWGIFPPLLTSQIGKAKALAPGSESRQFWEKVPFNLDFKVYVFNVTNANGVHQGEVPMLEEIGPYYFDEWKTKVDVVDFEEDDSVSFRMKNTYVFNEEKSAPLTGREVVTTVHPLLMGVVASTEREKPKLLKMINKAIPYMFDNPESVFLRGTALDFLFHGSFVNCTSKDFQVHAVCVVLQKEVPELVKTNVTGLFKHSVLGARNLTAEPHKYRVHRGIRKPQEVGEMVSLNDKKHLTFWRGRPCNDLLGTDSTVFPPGLEEGGTVWTYAGEVCRSLSAVYRSRSEYKEISSQRYTVGFGDSTADPSLKCFCPADDACLKKGAFDLMPCTGAPIVASLPHFLDAHDDYRNGVRGMHPERSKHEIVFDIEPMTGTPLYAKKRLMFSMPMHRVKNVPLTDNLPDVILPMFWVEESLELGDKFVGKIDFELFRIIRLVNVVKWMMMMVGAALATVAVGLYYKQKNSLTVTPSSSAGRRDAPQDRRPERKGFELDGGGQINFGYI